MKDRARSCHHFATDRAWLEALQYALSMTVGTREDRSIERPSVRVLTVGKSGLRFEIELRFHAGAWYCCAEPGCHLGTYDARWWARLRGHLGEVSDRRPPPMSVTVRTVIEQGACLRNLALIGEPFESEGGTYVHGPDEERLARS